MNYRKKLEEIIYKNQGKISPENKQVLDQIASSDNLSPEQIDEIEKAVKFDYEEKELSWQKIEELFSENLSKSNQQLSYSKIQEIVKIKEEFSYLDGEDVDYIRDKVLAVLAKIDIEKENSPEPTVEILIEKIEAILDENPEVISSEHIEEIVPEPTVEGLHPNIIISSINEGDDETERTYPDKDKDTIINLILKLGIILLSIICLGSLTWWFISKIIIPDVSNNTPLCKELNKNKSLPKEDKINLGEQISLGEKLLTNSSKEQEKAGDKALSEGINLFNQCNFDMARDKLLISLEKHKNNPEARIYLNNAKVSNKDFIKIATGIPIDIQPNLALEILRGVAQAQNEVNANGGINGKLLVVEIANDHRGEDENIVKILAEYFVKDNLILAIVGHDSSTSSLAGAPIYYNNGDENSLLMISPASNSTDLSQWDNVFRSVPDNKQLADKLADYINKKGLKKIAICGDEEAYSKDFSKKFKEKFIALNNKKESIDDKICNLSKNTWNSETPDNILNNLVSKNVDGLLLVPSVNKDHTFSTRAMNVAHANKNHKTLTIFGSSTLRTIDTLAEGQNAVEGMVLSVPWEKDVNLEFAKKASELWGGNAKVNMRTAGGYDATLAIIEGLRQSPSPKRSELIKALKNSNFQFKGANPEFKFNDSRTRAGQVYLIQIKAITQSESGTGLDFVLLKE